MGCGKANKLLNSHKIDQCKCSPVLRLLHDIMLVQHAQAGSDSCDDDDEPKQGVSQVAHRDPWKFSFHLVQWSIKPGPVDSGPSKISS